MEYYNYHPETFEYVSGPIQATIFPGRENLANDVVKKWKLPAHATWETLPEYDANTEIPVFHTANNSWTVEEDHRGETFYVKETKEEVVWSNTGEVSNTVTSLVPGEFDSWSVGLEQWVEQSSQKNSVFDNNVNLERYRRLLVGCTVTLSTAKEIPVAGTSDYITNLQGLVTAAQLRVGSGDLTTLTPFRDQSNVIQELTPMEVIELWQSAASYVSELYIASWVLKDADNEDKEYEDYANNAYWPSPVWPQP